MEAGWQYHPAYSAASTRSAIVARPMQPFTYRYYRGMLEAAVSRGYKLSSFARYDSAASKTVILRHDADYTLDGLLRFAEIERELGATATYFFRVHAEYNVFA